MDHLKSVSHLDVPVELSEALHEHLGSELLRDYKKNKANKGRRLFPSHLKSLSFEGEDGCAEVSEDGEVFEVTMSLPVFDMDGGYSSIICSCSRDNFQLEPERCQHMWVAQHALKELLFEAISVKENENLGVEAIFNSLDLAASSKTPEESNQESLAWQVNGNFEVSALLRTGRNRHPFKVLTWPELIRRSELWLNQSHQMLIPFIRVESAAATASVDHFKILVELSKQGGALDLDFEPLELQNLSTSLVGRTEDEQLIVEPKFSDGSDISFIYSGGGAVGRTKSGKVLISPLDEASGNLYQTLLHKKIPVPLDQQDRLLQYLAKLEEKIPISLDNVKSEGEADDRLIIRLTPFQTGAVKCDLLVKPSPSSTYMIPGFGMESVLDLSDPKEPKSLARDLWREQDHANEAAELLGLANFPRLGDGGFLLPGDQAALSVLDRLESSAKKDQFILEWPKNDGGSLKGQLELEGNLAEQKISVAIGEPQDWFQVKGKVTINGEDVDLKELMAALRKQQSYVQLPSGKWARISEVFKERLDTLSHLLDEDEGDLFVSPGQADEIARQEAEENIALEEASKTWWTLKKRLQTSQLRDENPADTFSATLRPYQLEGFRWLYRLSIWGMGACLADDMGLGKTIQALAVMEKHAARGPSLIVAPVSVAGNWQNESRRFTPSLEPYIYRGGQRLSLLENLMPGDIVIASYGVVWRDIEQLKDIEWNCIVLDEAQMIKNANSKTSKAIQQLKGQWTLALSGTPIENHLGDLWSLFRTINPGLLGSWDRFKRSYALPISREHNTNARERLERRIRPFILRRLKKDYLKELPSKTEVTLDVELSDDEMNVYKALRQEAIEKMDGGDSEMSEAQKRVAMLGALTRLRQAACHPSLVMDTWAKGSSKLELFSQLAVQVKENGHKALVFSQFTSHLALIRERLDELGMSYGYLDGGTPAISRQKQVEVFQEGKLDFFLISLKAGGTGITLTEADFVIHMDPWWNPAVEDQATDRAYRMGQTKPVTVYRLVSRGTVEEMILKIHEVKRNLASSLLENAGKVASLGSKDLMGLIQSGR